MWKYGSETPSHLISYDSADGAVTQTDSATLDHAACYFGLTNGCFREVPLADDARTKHRVSSSWKLYDDPVVHLSVFEGHLVACSRRSVTAVDLSRFEAEPDRRPNPFNDEEVEIQRARVVRKGAVTYLLVAGLDRRQQPHVHVLARRWRGPNPAVSAWGTWGAISDNEHFDWQPSGEVKWPGSCPASILDIECDGRIVVGGDDKSVYYLDLERRRVERFNISVPGPWPDSTANQTYSKVVCCDDSLQNGGTYFRLMVPFSKSLLGLLPEEILENILNQVRMAGG